MPVLERSWEKFLQSVRNIGQLGGNDDQSVWHRNASWFPVEFGLTPVGEEHAGVTSEIDVTPSPDDGRP